MFFNMVWETYVMSKMNQLKDLLQHEIQDLYSAEEQIIEALPAMIKKAKDSKLKKALQDHLKVTQVQKSRLDNVLSKLETEGDTEKKGFLSRLFESKKCKGMQGLITEGEKMMAEDMDPDVMDAAIVACAQKIEHYEISGYGTAKAFSEELGLKDVAKLLNDTLNEEYEADDLLTMLAKGRLNKEATSQRSKRSAAKRTPAKSRTAPAAKKSVPKKKARKKAAAK